MEVLRRLRTIPSPGIAWSRLHAWLTGAPHATVGFSLMRILLAIGMLLLLLPSFPDRHYLWGAGSWWVEPEARRRGWWDLFRAVFPKDDAVRFDLTYLALIAVVLLFLVGWKTRWVTPVLLVLWVGLSTNSMLLGNGGDTLTRIALAFALFADLSRHFSVDAWLRRRRPTPPARPGWLPPWLSPLLHNTALILCCYQILLVYFVSSVLKLGGEEWLAGTALYYALTLAEFQVHPALSELVWQSSPLVMGATWATLAVQLLFPVLLLWRPTRYFAVASVTLMHLGIGLLLGLWPFSLAMIALDLLLVRDRSWARLAEAARRGAAVARGLPRIAQAAADNARAA